ncbi:MAG: hypothetical protein JNM65_10445 [Verrucomicrobiaceae bacterium]|nr:hypothetical protein [Verrucomicrobiaceae bacterium]
MKTFLAALILLAPASAMCAPVLELAVIETVHGKVYRQCKIVRRDADGVAFTHQKGTARVLFSDLPEATRAELGYSPKAAAELQKTREHERTEREKQRQQKAARAVELRHAARLAEIKRLAQAPQVIVVQPPAGYYSGPVPAVGFAAPGRGGFYWTGGHHHGVTRNGGWDSVGIATIGAGSGGIYVPQSGGFLFTGLPQVQQSPSLGWYDPGGFASPAARSAGTFGSVPGLAVPNPPAVVPGVQIRGSVSMPAGH